MEDYSVRVSHLDRSEIQEALIKQKGLVRVVDVNKEQMRKSLAYHLKKKHPLHDRVKMLSNDQLFQLCSNLSLKITRREKDKMTRLVVDHFFRNYPEAEEV